MKIVLSYYEKNSITLMPIYDKRHYKEFTGKTAAECMKLVREFKENHDIVKYTASVIYDVFD